MATTVQTVNDDVLVSVTEQLRDLQPVKDKQVELADLRGKLEQLKNLLDGTHGIPNDPTIASLMTHKIADPDAGGLIEQVKLMVWHTIESQTELKIAEVETGQAKVLAQEADQLLAAGKYIEAYRQYCLAYQKLVPTN